VVVVLASRGGFGISIGTFVGGAWDLAQIEIVARRGGPCTYLGTHRQAGGRCWPRSVLASLRSFEAAVAWSLSIPGQDGS
jgi:hypothetical protein